MQGGYNGMIHPGRIDLHTHTTVSDGTVSPKEMIALAKKTGLELFSVTDHDAVKGCKTIIAEIGEDDPLFICGAEFSARDEFGKYHILGYGYDPDSDAIKKLVKRNHANRMNKVRKRLEFLKDEYGFDFPEDDLKKLLSLDNPGKPHIGNLMVKYGYAKTRTEAIKDFIDKAHVRGEIIGPGEIIDIILAGGGIPVLAHPFYGNGDQLIIGDEMEERLKHLIAYGLQGVEAFYSGFTAKLIESMLGYAKTYGLYVTAGSDFHGSNKMIGLGDTNLSDSDEMPDGMKKFLENFI